MSDWERRIAQLGAKRRQHKRVAARHRRLRNKALAARRWEDARHELKIVRRHRRGAKQCLKDQRIIRRARTKANRLARIVRHRRKVLGASGISWYDGKQVASLAVAHLKWARSNGWRGYVTSGYRSPEYSRSLCRAMCGADRCLGRCAGVASNHVGLTIVRFAVDLTDYYTFGGLMRRSPHSPRIYNALGRRDPVHFSPSGN